MGRVRPVFAQLRHRLEDAHPKCDAGPARQRIAVPRVVCAHLVQRRIVSPLLHDAMVGVGNVQYIVRWRDTNAFALHTAKCKTIRRIV